MIWQEKRHLLIGLGVLLLANVIFFFTYRVRYEQRVRDLDLSYDQAQADLAAARSARAAAQARVGTYRRTVEDIKTVYNDWWSTPDERLTSLLLEIRRLAEASNMVPTSVTYGRTDAKKERAAAASMTIGFSVRGPYRNARQLINMIELSKQFVTIDSISLTGDPSANGDITLSLSLRTLFHDSSATEAKRNKA